VIQRAKNFSAASRRILQICNGEKLPVVMSIPTLTPFGGRPVSGIADRPALLNPKAVFKEIATQALTHRGALAPGSPTSAHWQWPPRYVAMPPLLWKPYEAVDPNGPARKRIRGKKRPQLPSPNQPNKRTAERAAPNPLDEENITTNIIGPSSQGQQNSLKRTQEEINHPSSQGTNRNCGNSSQASSSGDQQFQSDGLPPTRKRLRTKTHLRTNLTAFTAGGGGELDDNDLQE
jgi:hypothetical protein